VAGFSDDSDGNAVTLPQCKVLIVDDDVAFLEESVELLSRLGYHCIPAADAPAALQILANDAAIGIVITDIRMPGMDGLSLLNELSERFMQMRPMVGIVMTAQSSIDQLVTAMRASAIDFIEKPVTVDGMAAALRRATSRWARLATQYRLARLAEPHRSSAASDGTEPRQPSVEELQKFATALLKARQTRAKYFNPQILSGPAWGMLIDLTAAGLKGEALPTSSVCATSGVSFSTALRHVAQLVDAGLVRRAGDPSDKRRTLLQIEPEALDLMVRYLSSSLETLNAPDP
jgi:FixJ family two-component response regulator/DNA-binding MarR family transcriptional regulator